ncbi:hypothetical protein ACRALDRAFT_1093071 [Sodiomyces alcalophilus JCM 7366]|uniref:uncharacterized protein n=1 Tax=Sodiomyces alcalophilus JCM 7366 TaxID=591952 RepID=UPI0039B4BECF
MTITSYFRDAKKYIVFSLGDEPQAHPKIRYSDVQGFSPTSPGSPRKCIAKYVPHDTAWDRISGFNNAGRRAGNEPHIRDFWDLTRLARCPRPMEAVVPDLAERGYAVRALNTIAYPPANRNNADLPLPYPWGITMSNRVVCTEDGGARSYARNAETCRMTPLAIGGIPQPVERQAAASAVPNMVTTSVVKYQISAVTLGVGGDYTYGVFVPCGEVAIVPSNNKRGPAPTSYFFLRLSISCRVRLLSAATHSAERKLAMSSVGYGSNASQVPRDLAINIGDHMYQDLGQKITNQPLQRLRIDRTDRPGVQFPDSESLFLHFLLCSV